MLKKSVLRTIRKSLGRYLAILAIIALGVGFFAGLCVTQKAMLKTADDYLTELHLYDFRLVSTLGLTQEDVQAFQALDGITNAYGAVSADFIYSNRKGSDVVLHASTLNDGVNGLDIISGRLPEKADECVLDALFFNGVALGDQIVLSESNSEDTLNTFAYDRYTVVGLANASVYATYERGTTTLAGGAVAGFVYLLPAGFHADCYTEIYLTIPYAGEICSAAYENTVDTFRPSVEGLLQKRAQLRYETLYSEAETMLKDAQAEVNDAQMKLDDAKVALSQQKEQLAAMQAAHYPVELLTAAQAKIDEAKSKIDETQEQINNAQSEVDEGRKQLAQLQPATVYTLDRSSNLGYISLQNDTAIVSGVAKVFPFFFFLVAALVCITTMTRMVSEQRTQNGVLKALGYSNAAIGGQYLFYAGSASALGCIIGFLVGSRLMPMALWQVYRILYSIERPIAYVLDWKLFALCTALYLFCALGATYWVCCHDLRESAAQLIRPKTPVAGKQILLEHIGFLWKRLKFLHKISIRNILRYKKRMVMMILGIGGCTALLLTGFGIRDTIQPIVDYQFSEITLYDAAFSFQTDLKKSALTEFSKTADSLNASYCFLYTENAEISSSNGSDTLNLVVYEDAPTAFIDLHRNEATVEWPKEGEIALNYRFANEQKLSVGDTVLLSDESNRTLKLTVSGIFDNYIHDYAYVDAASYHAQLNQTPTFNTAYVTFAEGTDEHAESAVLMNTEHTASVNISADLLTRVVNMLDRMNYIVLIVLVCAGALAFIVLYNLTNITITERTREIATLKVLGFFRSEQNSYVFRENLVLTALSALCGIPMGIALLHYVMSQIKVRHIYFGCRLTAPSYLWAIALTFLFTLIIDLALTTKTKRINMAEAMKAVE